MRKVILTKGLQASGKTSWAKEQVLAHPNNYKNVCKDDLRRMIDCNGRTKNSEKFILEMRDKLILEFLGKGKSVIVSDTNLNPVHESHIRELVKGMPGVEVEVKFFDVPLDECITPVTIITTEPQINAQYSAFSA